MTVLDVISKDQLKALLEAGYVVIHREPTASMISAGTRHEWPENWSPEKLFHRMVGESIRLQNKELAKQIKK